MRGHRDSISVLNRNFKELQQAGNLEAGLPLLDAMKVTLTNAQFEIAITDLRMSRSNVAVARQFFVDGKTASELQKEEGVSPSRLSKIVSRVTANYQKQLDVLNLVSAEYTLDKATAKLVRELEASKISEAKLKAYLTSGKPARKPAARAKKKSPKKAAKKPA